MIQNDILEKAIIFATQSHAGQKRRGNNSPYILHPARVMAIVYNTKVSNNLNFIMAVCMLHDTVEDCKGVTLEDIARLFGHHVAACVQELTTDDKLCKEMGKGPYLLSKMLTMSNYALCVKLADRLDNLRDMTTLSPKSQYNKVEETIFILKGLKNRKLTATHLEIIRLIEIELNKYSL